MTFRALHKASRGAFLLGRLGKTQEEIANACRVSRALVGHWRNGVRVPSEKDRARLAAKFAIPGAAWDEPPPPPAVRTPPAEIVISSTDGARELALKLAQKASRLLDRVETDEDASYREHAAALGAVLQTLRLLVSCELDEERIIRSPEWKRIEDMICEALRPYPEAAEAVSHVLRGMRAA